jgi:hypothetical protein
MKLIFGNLMRKNKEWMPPTEQEFFSDVRKIKNFQNAAIRAFQENRNYFNSNIPRQSGRTFIGLRLALWSAISKPQSHSLFITNKKELSNFHTRNMGKILADLNIPHEKMVASRYRFELPNKSMISFIPISDLTDVEKFRGKNFEPRIDFICYDEYDWFDRSQTSEALNNMTTHRAIDGNTIHLGLSSNYFNEMLKHMFPQEIE